MREGRAAYRRVLAPFPLIQSVSLPISFSSGMLIVLPPPPTPPARTFTVLPNGMLIAAGQFRTVCGKVSGRTLGDEKIDNFDLS